MLLRLNGRYWYINLMSDLVIYSFGRLEGSYIGLMVSMKVEEIWRWDIVWVAWIHQSTVESCRPWDHKCRVWVGDILVSAVCGCGISCSYLLFLWSRLRSQLYM